MEMKILNYICCVLTLITADDSRKHYKIGALFDVRSKELRETFRQEVRRLSLSDNHTLFTEVLEAVDCQDSFNVSNAICHLLEQQVYGMLGAFQPCALSTIQSYTDRFNVPFISLSMPQLSTSKDPYQLYIRPYYVPALLDIVANKEWRKIYYIYETNEGLVRLQQLFQVINKREVNMDIVVRRIVSIHQCHMMLRSIYNIEVKEDLRLLVDLSLPKSQELISAIKNDPDINNLRFHFVAVDLNIKDMNETVLSAGMNVTGFSLPRPKWNSPSVNMTSTIGVTLVHDAVNIFNHALQHAGAISDSEIVEQINCRDNRIRVPIRAGKQFLKKVRSAVIDGHSGRVMFDENGLRKDFKLPLYETGMNMRLSKIGDYRPGKGLEVHDPETTGGEPHVNKSIHDVVRRIVTVEEPPYVMYTEEAEKMNPLPLCGIEHFQGYIVDLIKEVANHIQFKYKVCLESSYGSKLTNGTWNGVIGKLTRHMADIGFGGMTITSERERVVDFTKPFMSLGISIMIKKPENKKTRTFSFMEPLSYEIWMCILFAYVGVSVVLFLVSRFSPTEWNVEDDKTITNAFTISNSLWYSLGAFMQQGCDVSPKSVSGRIVGSVWWFFTLIIISSYTANLAAFLTVERMNTPIESAEDLAKQTKIQYGTLRSGTTYDFFKLSQVAVYERMFAYMTSAKDVFVPKTEMGIAKVREMNGKYAYLIESTTNEYINSRSPCDTMKVGSNLDSKGYGIATPIGSDLRDRLTLAVLHLREKGVLQQLKKRWWEDKSQCDKLPSTAGSEAELKLKNVAGIFYILIGGLTLSVIMAGIEFLYKSVVESRKSEEGFGTIVRNKARLSFRGSIDATHDHPDSSTQLNQPGISGTYKYTGPKDIPGFDPYEDTQLYENTSRYTEV